MESLFKACVQPFAAACSVTAALSMVACNAGKPGQDFVSDSKGGQRSPHRALRRTQLRFLELLCSVLSLGQDVRREVFEQPRHLFCCMLVADSPLSYILVEAASVEHFRSVEDAKDSR